MDLTNSSPCNGLARVQEWAFRLAVNTVVIQKCISRHT